MATLNEQKRELVNENANLILAWMEKLGAEGSVFVIQSLLKKYSVSDLKTMNAHVKERINAIS